MPQENEVLGMKVDVARGGIEEIVTVARELGAGTTGRSRRRRTTTVPPLVSPPNTERIELGTHRRRARAHSDALANIGNDLQEASGAASPSVSSQIKPHIEKRFSMPWSHPAARMREFILALRAIWACWNDGEKLEFRGEFYTHTLMTPMFDQGPSAVRRHTADLPRRVGRR
jgi:hypothetical protein